MQGERVLREFNTSGLSAVSYFVFVKTVCTEAGEVAQHFNHELHHRFVHV